uniref:RING-type domain-containing protein n=1 Tax=Laticauda laticaudata TaxID=8630 RepID=A0A8C5WRC3_LATLA
GLDDLQAASEARSELECGICCMPYDCCERAPRRLGSARGSWKPSHCRHVICTACVCQLAREGWWEEVTCPYCRTVTSLRDGGWRRRLVLPPIDTELWQRLVLQKREQDQAGRVEHLAGDEDLEEEKEQENGEVEHWRPWRTLKKLLKGGGQANCRLSSLLMSVILFSPTAVSSEMKDLALVTCYVI